MVKSLLTVLLAILAAVLLLRDVESYAADASTQPSSDDAWSSVPPTPGLPDPRSPFDMTPITPVESTGAPMYGV
jgi:hypothetical protein